ncbi:type III PLP-dependent enzyme [Paenibacillus sp. P25]|nr:type III PLP-dependent enzyme [Paenibacillus sp. P25]
METGVKAAADAQLADIIASYGTPLYVYHGEVVKEKLKALRSCFPPEAEIFYSMKCNPLLGIAQFLRRQGCRVEVASGGELTTALEAGFEPGHIIFTSPGKTVAELELAVHHEIYSINIENIEEIQMIDSMARKHGKVVSVSLRVNPNVQGQAAGIQMSGVASQFGLDEALLPEAITAIRRSSHVRLIGFHVYLGTQILQEAAIIRHIRDTVRMSLDYARQYGMELEFIDVGGGFGIPYFSKETGLDLTVLKEGLKELWDTFRESLTGIRLAVESGRYLMAESGVFVTRVLYRKESKGNTYLICDGGSHQHASSAFLGRYIRNNFPMRVLAQTGEPEEVYVTGPLCTATDVLGQKVVLPRAEAGDVIVIEKSGAYGLTHSPVLFLSHPPPAEVLVDQGHVYLLRERGTGAIS